MLNQPGMPARSSQRCCDVCDGPVAYLDTLQQRDQAYICCRSAGCRQILDRQSVITGAQFDFYLNFHRKINRDRRLELAARKEATEKLLRQQEEENQRIMASVLEQFAGFDNAAIPLVVIPSGAHGARALTADRIERYTAHLSKVIKQAEAGADLAGEHVEANRENLERLQRVERLFAGNAQLHAISDQLCCMCKGGCCGNGRDEAYVSAATVHRYRASNPDMSADEVLDSYLSMLPDQAVPNSCINHTDQGCALPRSMRSDVCNGYYCKSLSGLHAENTGKTAGLRVLAIQRSNSNWSSVGPENTNEFVGAALVNAQGRQDINTDRQ